MDLLDGMEHPTAAERDALARRLGTTQTPSGLVIHQHALTVHRRDLAARGAYRGPYFVGRRIVLRRDVS